MTPTGLQAGPLLFPMCNEWLSWPNNCGFTHVKLHVVWYYTVQVERAFPVLHNTPATSIANAIPQRVHGPHGKRALRAANRARCVTPKWIGVRSW